MRCLDARAFHLIIPAHVERSLRGLRRKTARKIREELGQIAVDFGRSPPPWRDSWVMLLEIDSVKVEYECDPENRAVIALDVLDAEAAMGD